jgi:hypothetical protein
LTVTCRLVVAEARAEARAEALAAAAVALEPGGRATDTMDAFRSLVRSCTRRGLIPVAFLVVTMYRTMETAQLLLSLHRMTQAPAALPMAPPHKAAQVPAALQLAPPRRVAQATSLPLPLPLPRVLLRPAHTMMHLLPAPHKTAHTMMHLRLALRRAAHTMMHLLPAPHKAAHTMVHLRPALHRPARTTLHLLPTPHRVAQATMTLLTLIRAAPAHMKRMAMAMVIVMRRSKVMQAIVRETISLTRPTGKSS